MKRKSPQANYFYVQYLRSRSGEIKDGCSSLSVDGDGKFDESAIVHVVLGLEYGGTGFSLRIDWGTRPCLYRQAGHSLVARY